MTFNIQTISKDVGSIIFDLLSYPDIQNFSISNKSIYFMINEKYFYNRTFVMYPSTIKNKTQDTWRKHVIESEYYISKLYNEFGEYYNDNDEMNPRLFYITRYLLHKFKYKKQIFHLHVDKILTLGCELGVLELVKYAINRGANIEKINVFNLCSKGPLKFNNDRVNTIKYLMEKGVRLDSIGLLTPVCSKNRFEILKILVENNYPNNEKSEPLFKSCLSGNLNMVKYLLKNYNFNKQNINDAISLANENKKFAIARYLNKIL